MFNIRFADGNDAIEILDIYAPYVSYTPVTFECEVPRNYEMKRRINTVRNTHPWLVCETDGIIAGYAYAYKLSDRSAYDWSAELSVYIREDYQRCNIASALYFALIEILKMQGFCTAFAKITIPNEKSVAFHTAFGFMTTGVLHNSGYKLGQWNDVAIMEKSLVSEYPKTPSKITPITEIDNDKAKEIFTKAAKIIKVR